MTTNTPHGPEPTRMRLVIDGLIALTLVLVLGGVLLHQRARGDQLRQVEATQHAIRAIQSQSLYRGSLGEVEVTRRGYPLRVDPQWFDPCPANQLAGIAANWVDFVDEADADLFNPRHITADGKRGAFWYNPHRGLIRARVTRQPSEQATVDLYNLVNGTSLRVEDVRVSLSANGSQLLANRR